MKFMHWIFKGNHLSAISDDDMLVGIDGQWPMAILGVAFESWRPVRCEQSSVLGHT